MGAFFVATDNSPLHKGVCYAGQRLDFEWERVKYVQVDGMELDFAFRLLGRQVPGFNPEYVFVGLDAQTLAANWYVPTMAARRKPAPSSYDTGF